MPLTDSSSPIRWQRVMNASLSNCSETLSFSIKLYEQSLIADVKSLSTLCKVLDNAGWVRLQLPNITYRVVSLTASFKQLVAFDSNAARISQVRARLCRPM